MSLLQLLLASSLFLLAACEKKDHVMTPQEEAEYQRMMNESMAKHPPPTYEQLKEENEELKRKQMQDVMQR